MAHILTITYTSPTAILVLTLNDNSNYKVINWTPAVAGSYDTSVTERMELDIMGSTTAILQKNYQNFNNAFNYARKYAISKVGTPVVMSYTPDGGTAAISYILDGSIEWGENGALPPWTFTAKKIRVFLNITRTSYWMGTRTYVPIYNTNGTATEVSKGGTALAVYNANDQQLYLGTPDYLSINWFDIPGTCLTGDIPGNLELYVYNPNAAAIGTFDMFMSSNQLSYPGSFDHWMEAEESVVVTGIGTAVGSSTCSGGSIITGSAGLAIYWPMRTDYANYNKFQHAIRFPTPPASGNWIQSYFYDPGLNPIYTGPKNYLNAAQSLQFTDIITIPPNNPAFSTSTNSYLVTIYGGTGNISIDYETLFPLDGWLRLYQTGGSFPINAGTPNDYYINYDPENSLGNASIAYFYNSAKGKYSNLIARGPGFNLQPGIAARIYMLYREGIGSSLIYSYLKFEAYYTSRRLSI
jgi:hypothetical protein